METITLKVANREVLGKEVKALRREGITPANIFGHGIESQAVQTDTVEAQKVLAKAGTTHLISLRLPAKKESHRVLVKKVQRDIITGKLLHIDFYQVRMKDKVRVAVPLIFQGESPASDRKDLMLLESLSSLEVECLPDDIPESIPVDLSELAEAGDHLLVSDLTLSDGITVLTHPEEVLARVSHARVAEVEEVVEEEVEEEVEEAVAEKPEEEPVAE